MADSLSASLALQILHLALGQPIGLLLATNDPERARQKLYAARAQAQNAALASLQIRTSPFEDGQLVIVNQQARLEQRPQDENEGL